jgi:NADPH-ferrihemoprotein reductase
LEQELTSIYQRDPASQSGRSAKVTDFEEFKDDVFAKHQLVIICAATHYEGDPCDNTKKFFRWLRDARKNKENKGLLKGVRYAVFGLGDSSYEQFNFIGKFINEGMEELGAERVYKYGEGNAEGNHTEDDFNEWKAEIWNELFNYYKTNVTQA